MTNRQQHDEPANTTVTRNDTTFAREGPEPPENDTGTSVDDMNRKAERAVIRNVRPDEQID